MHERMNVTLLGLGWALTSDEATIIADGGHIERLQLLSRVVSLQVGCHALLGARPTSASR
jgi:hypothetical protein